MIELDFSTFGKEVRTVGFFGVGVSTLALMKRVPKGIKITLRSDNKIDTRALPQGVKVEKIYDGTLAFSDITEDVLFLSPSVRRDRRELMSAVEGGVILSSDFEYFSAVNDKPLFLISGSDGKSTAVTMLSELLSRKNEKILPIGNVGRPFCDALEDTAWAHVAELSSFQLLYSCPASYRAALTSVTPNHLNWHPSLEEYVCTKLELLKKSSAPIASLDQGIIEDFAKGRELFGVTDTERAFSELKDKFKAQIYLTVESGMICKNGVGLISTDKILRREKYNLKNLMTAIAMANGYTTKDDILRLAQSFKGLSHRCEEFFSKDGVNFIDSSIDTTPARTATTLNSLEGNVIVILGGLGKGVPYDELCEPLKRCAGEIIITGANRYEILSAVDACAPCYLAENLKAAAALACSHARRGDTVILSPASTSYDAFSNYQIRGDFFKSEVENFYK